MLRKLESSFIVSNYKIDRTLGGEKAGSVLQCQQLTDQDVLSHSVRNAIMIRNLLTTSATHVRYYRRLRPLLSRHDHRTRSINDFIVGTAFHASQYMPCPCCCYAECMMKSNYRAKAKSSSSYHVGGNVRYCHVVPIRDLEYFHSYEFLAAFKSHYFLVKFAESETPFNDGEDWKECDAVNCSIQYLGAEEVPKYKVKCGIGKIGPAVTEDGRYLEGKVLSNSLQYGGNVSFGAWPTWTGFRKPNHGDPWVATDVVYLTVFFQPAA